MVVGEYPDQAFQVRLNQLPHSCLVVVVVNAELGLQTRKTTNIVRKCWKLNKKEGYSQKSGERQSDKKGDKNGANQVRKLECAVTVERE